MSRLHPRIDPAVLLSPCMVLPTESCGSCLCTSRAQILTMTGLFEVPHASWLHLSKYLKFKKLRITRIQLKHSFYVSPLYKNEKSRVEYPQVEKTFFYVNKKHEVRVGSLLLKTEIFSSDTLYIPNGDRRNICTHIIKQ